MTKAAELREMSDEQLRLTLKEAAENLFRLQDAGRRPKGWTHPANFASNGD